MLGDEDRERQGGRQGAQELLDRRGSAGRGGDAEDADHLVGGEQVGVVATALVGGQLAGGPLEALLDERLGAGHEAHDAEAADHADLLQEVLLDRAQVGADVATGLGDEVHRAELERAEHVVTLAVARDDDHRQRALGHQQAQEGEAVHLRHLEVEGDDVRQQVEGLAQRLLAVRGAADDLDHRVRLEHRADRLPVVGRVVDDEHPDLLAGDAWRWFGGFHDDGRYDGRDGGQGGRR